MTKVLRLHTGVDTITGWQNSNVIGNKSISDIKDPENGNIEKEITSIPSPFARIDLVRNAFEQVVQNKGLKCDSIYHKMVSDSLDIGEIFFNFEKYKNLFEIIIWDKSLSIEKLEKSSRASHQSLAKTLKMYLEQDKNIYNFDKFDRLYLLNYIGAGMPDQMNIIGATSPCSMFFSSANDLSYLSDKLANKPFDKNSLQPLHERDSEFIKYLWAFKANYGSGFATDLKVMNDYMNEEFAHMSAALKQELHNINQGNIGNFDKIAIPNATGNFVEVLNLSLHLRPQVDIISSDFEIASKIYQGKKPLVLPIESGNDYTSLCYYQKNWSKTDKAPYFDNNQLSSRTLPIIGDKYPYLTVSDFLTDNIIKMPLEFNSQHFYDGNMTLSSFDKEDRSYLPPISPLFFEFFTVDELMGKMQDGKNMFEMQEISRNISVTLRIPIKGATGVRYIEYERRYNQDNLEANLGTNSGGVISATFSIGMLPLCNTGNITPHTILGVFDFGQNSVTIKPYCGSSEATSIEEQFVRCEKITGTACSVDTYIISQKIDHIRTNVNEASGIILPKQASQPNFGNAVYTFAVDLGTTNTHIEYSIDNGVSQVFDIKSTDQQLVTLHENYEEYDVIEKSLIANYIPDKIGSESLYKFPMRTVVAQYDKIDYTKPTFAFSHVNIPFYYEKVSCAMHNTFVTELKWSKDKENQVEKFIENILILLRNKVLLNGGALDKTRIVWTYPSSMTNAHHAAYKEIWEKLYRKFFNSSTMTNIQSLSESVAPYEYYQSKGAKSNTVTIDVGGGTTDIFAVENDNPVLLSSFRFAANSIFGDGYKINDADKNGFVNKYLQDFKNAISSNNLKLESVLSDFEKTKNSLDIISFFFSLNEANKKEIDSLNFLKKLQGDELMKYPFIIFYSAIIYHIATLMKAKGLEMPRTIAFSGNGSKCLNVLTTNNDSITEFFKLIIEDVFQNKYSKSDNLEVQFDSNPKESTCKGAIIATNGNKIIGINQIQNIKSSLIGNNGTSLTEGQSIDVVNEKMMNDVCEEYEKFIDTIFQIHKNNNSFFVQQFGVNAKILSDVKDICLQNTNEYIRKGIKTRKEELRRWNSEELLDETLFFMPIIGVLNNLATVLTKI